ncbi:MAG TPA: DUF4062 domain-containing protein [Gordonia sp. (in: high G+C Gram-positive bacteria)]|uniref:DUF4062 domain-containing protein n=1 Tax=Gordonia sp. (in: high G+C Gram-positive bacteria) TaxID=84139 RepID=UPI002BC85E86|nr:AAA family ATPase [Gordonia sp. (in: high G+C Gram-positive bacteria)]HNP57997.1 DUF4062 domain-containing protein [Gordonia sp. (in: high G+C Gram-positive bacteria)]HRC51736.1 DUF4062 domain-containing protein [Gordonia sp. (in: high G+C Gram-positive bacteria)]
MAIVPVFVSSTFRDFHGERDVLAGVVRERLDERVKDLGCRVEVIDLRWGVDTEGVDEEEAARRVVDVCLQQVARARPLFVGLVGERVGYVPDGVHARWVAAQAGVPADQRVEGLSVTELEFGFGMLWDSAPDGEHVVVFRDLAGTAPADWVDPDRDRVAAFRDDVAAKAEAKNVVSLRYEAVADGASDTVDLANVVADGERVSFEDLMVGVLSGPVRRRAELVIAESGGGWVGAERLFRDDHTVAVGREPLIGDLTARMAVGGRVVLVGESGTGKSTVLCAVEDRLRADPELTVVSVLVGASSTGVSGRDVVVRLVEQLQPLIGRELSAPTDGDEDAFIQWWRDVLTEAATVVEGRLVIVVDALDALADDRAQSDVWPARVIPSSIGLLCSTTSPDQAEVLGGVGVETVAVDELAPSIAMEAARLWAGQTGRALPASVLAIIGEARRSPLWVRLAVDLMSDLDEADFASIAEAADQAAAIEQLLFDEARSLPSDTVDLAGVFLGRVAERIGDEPAALILGVLATAKSGFVPVALSALLHGAPDADLTVAVLQRVLGAQLRTTDGAGRLTFAHAIIQEHAATLAVPDVHTRIVEVLARDDVWDDTDALDAIWHTIAASAESDDGEQPVLAAVLARAANHSPPAGELVLMRALDAHASSGIALVGQLDRSLLSDDAMTLIIEGPAQVDRRYVAPHDRVELSRSVVGLARTGESEARDREVFIALMILGDDRLIVGDLDGALVVYEESVQINRELVQAQPGSVKAQRDLGLAMYRFGAALQERGDLDDALAVSEEAMGLSRGLAQAQPESAQAQRDLALALHWAGGVRQARGDLDGALAVSEEAMGLLRGLAQAQPESVRAQRDLGVAVNRVGGVRLARGDLDGALAAFEESLGLLRGLAQAQPGSVGAERDLGLALHWVGGVQEARGDLDGAAMAFEESLEIDRGLVQAQPGSMQAQRDLSVALNRAGGIRDARGDLDGAAMAFEESLEIDRGLVQALPESMQAQRSLGVALIRVGGVRQARGDLQGALVLFEESLDLLRTVVQAQPESPQAATDLGVSLSSVAKVRRELGDSAAARAMIEDAVALARETYEAHPELVRVKSELASALTAHASILDDLNDPEGAARARAEAAELEGPQS